MQEYLYVMVLKELHYRLIQITETYLEPLITNNAKFIHGQKFIDRIKEYFKEITKNNHDRKLANSPNGRNS